MRVANAPWRLRRNIERANRDASKSGVGCIGHIAVCLPYGSFLGKTGSYIGGTPGVGSDVLRNSVTLQPSLHCSLTRFEAHLYGASPIRSPFQSPRTST